MNKICDQLVYLINCIDLFFEIVQLYMMPTLDWLFVDPFRVLRFAKSIVKQIYKLNTGYHKMIELSHKQFRLMFTLVAYFSCITNIVCMKCL